MPFEVRKPAGARRFGSDQRPFRADERHCGRETEMQTRGQFLQTGHAAPGGRPSYTRGMKIVPEITAGRRAFGICVMLVVPLLHIATEYLGTGDRGRALSKLLVILIGLPILISGLLAGLRWAAHRRLGPLVLLIGGMLSAATLYA